MHGPVTLVATSYGLTYLLTYLYRDAPASQLRSIEQPTAAVSDETHKDLYSSIWTSSHTQEGLPLAQGKTRLFFACALACAFGAGRLRQPEPSLGVASGRAGPARGTGAGGATGASPGATFCPPTPASPLPRS